MFFEQDRTFFKKDSMFFAVKCRKKPPERRLFGVVLLCCCKYSAFPVEKQMPFNIRFHLLCGFRFAYGRLR